MMPSDMQEKTPGVYVRADDHELPHELDLLWSNSRHAHKEDRSPVIPFIVGLLVGAGLTTAVFLLFLMHPQLNTGQSEITAPVSGEMRAGGQPGTTTTGAPAEGNALNAPVSSGTTYKVVSGDTLGRIAEKVYGSSDPALLDKIQRANHMSSPDKLQIDQTLTIPPQSN